MKSPREKVENSLGMTMAGDVGNESCKLGGRPKREGPHENQSKKVNASRWQG